MQKRVNIYNIQRTRITKHQKNKTILKTRYRTTEQKILGKLKTNTSEHIALQMQIIINC